MYVQITNPRFEHDQDVGDLTMIDDRFGVVRIHGSGKRFALCDSVTGYVIYEGSAYKGFLKVFKDYAWTIIENSQSMPIISEKSAKARSEKTYPCIVYRCVVNNRVVQECTFWKKYSIPYA